MEQISLRNARAVAHGEARGAKHAEPGAASGKDAELALYDDPVVQRGFVRARGRQREALLLIEGIRCSACAARNEKTLAGLPGVLSAEVNFSTHRATVRWDDQAIKLSQILGAVARIGYRASPYDRDGAERARFAERRDALWRLFVACFGMMQVMMYAFPVYMAGDGEMTPDIEQLMRWASFVLTVPVVVYSAAPFFRGAWRDLKTRQLGMDVPVAMGVAIAFGASLVATLVGGAEVYYDSVTMFVFLLLLGRFLELLARQRAAAALAHLNRLIPEFAHRLDDFPASHTSNRIPVASLKAGDHVMVKPGETFPADGVVVQGSGSASEALLTGEARPVAKQAGSAVTGGSVNLAAPLVVGITRVGDDTVLSSILRLVGRGSADKPRLIRLADRVASHFIFLVLALALLAGLYWSFTDPARAVLVVVSVLVATCPCALSLAMPVALTAATGTLAGRGLVVCRGHTIEALAGATDVVFDKTGTLTRGEPRLIEVRELASQSQEQCLAIAAAMEAASEHPIASALIASGSALPAGALSQIRNVPGAGMEALIDGRHLRLGTRAFVRELLQGQVQSGGPRDDAEEGTPSSEPSRDTVVWLGDASGMLASFRLADTFRPEAEAVVAGLAAAGLKLHLLSGDDLAPTRELGQALGIASIEARANPARKLDYVRALQSAARKVVMIGDGINDSPVLAQADVSIAMGSGTRLAQTQADAVLLEGALGVLPDAIAVARKSMSVIRQNVMWAFGYNLLVLPLAFAGELTPWAAAIGMSASSLIVVMNALRLQDRRGKSAAAAEVPLRASAAA